MVSANLRASTGQNLGNAGSIRVDQRFLRLRESSCIRL